LQTVNIILWDMILCNIAKFIHVSEECTAPIFRTEKLWNGGLEGGGSIYGPMAGFCDGTGFTISFSCHHPTVRNFGFQVTLCTSLLAPRGPPNCLRVTSRDAVPTVTHARACQSVSGSQGCPVWNRKRRQGCLYFIRQKNTVIGPAGPKQRRNPGSEEQQKIITLPDHNGHVIPYSVTWSCSVHSLIPLPHFELHLFCIQFIRTIALQYTQPLTELSTRRPFWSKSRPARKADNLTVIC
jgi:hypothetical protein